MSNTRKEPSIQKGLNLGLLYFKFIRRVLYCYATILLSSLSILVQTSSEVRANLTWEVGPWKPLGMPADVSFSPRDVGDEPGGREDEREGEVDDGGPRGGDGDATDGGVGFLIISVIVSFLILISNTYTMFA